MSVFTAGCIGLVVIGLMLAATAVVILRCVAGMVAKNADASLVEQMFTTFQSAMKEVLVGVDRRFCTVEMRMTRFGERMDKVEQALSGKGKDDPA